MAHSLHDLVVEQCCSNFNRALDRDIVLAVGDFYGYTVLFLYNVFWFFFSPTVSFDIFTITKDHDAYFFIVAMALL
jgi:hypothetical protein